jgi:hypothetical protein
MPRQFFSDFVEPTIAEWRADPRNVRLATIALSQLDILAERFILQTSPKANREEVAAERDSIAGVRPFVGIARDVHDTHKHGPLTRGTAKITQGQRPRVVEEGLGISGGTTISDTASISGGVLVLTVVLDDGATHPVESVIKDVLDYWTAELKHVGR